MSGIIERHLGARERNSMASNTSEFDTALGSFGREFEWLCEYVRIGIGHLTGASTNELGTGVLRILIDDWTAGTLFRKYSAIVRYLTASVTEDEAALVKDILKRLELLNSSRNQLIHSVWMDVKTSDAAMTRVYYDKTRELKFDRHDVPAITQLTNEAGWLALLVDHLSLTIETSQPIGARFEWSEQGKVIRS
jgi:hypothetical protein